jgi:hypothetical protein
MIPAALCEENGGDLESPAYDGPICGRCFLSMRYRTHLENIENCLLSLIVCVEEYEGWKRATSEVIFLLRTSRRSLDALVMESRTSAPVSISPSLGRVSPPGTIFHRPSFLHISRRSAFVSRKLSPIGTYLLRLLPICFYHATMRSVKLRGPIDQS